MGVDYKKMITNYIAEQNYEAIVALGKENNARALRYVQMNIWGDYRKSSVGMRFRRWKRWRRPMQPK